MSTVSTAPLAMTRNWDMMLRTRSEVVHLTSASDPAARTSTVVLLDRTPIVDGREPMLRDTLLVLTTVHRGDAYQSLAGVVVRQQFAWRTVLIQPTSLTLLDTRPGAHDAAALNAAHEDAVNLLAARYRDEPGFRDRFTIPG